MHALSTPRFDAERQEWSEDTMRFDTVVYWCEIAGRLINGVGRRSQGTLDLAGGQNSGKKTQVPCSLVDVVLAIACVYACGMCATGCSLNYIG